MSFKEKFMKVMIAKGFSETDINEAKQYVRDAWGDSNLKECWINWINAEHAKGWR